MANLPLQRRQRILTRSSPIQHDTLLPALEHLHFLTHLRLVFHCETWWGHRDYEPHKAWSTEEDLLLEDLRPESKFDFAAVASAIAAALPSLRYCFLTNSAWVAETKVTGRYSVVERWRELRAWRVARRNPSLSRAHGVPVDDRELLEATGSDCAVDACGTAAADQGEPELVALHDDVAETIMEREDLVLSEEEKASAIVPDSQTQSGFALTSSLLRGFVQTGVRWDD